MKEIKLSSLRAVNSDQVSITMTLENVKPQEIKEHIATLNKAVLDMFEAVTERDKEEKKILIRQAKERIESNDALRVELDTLIKTDLSSRNLTKDAIAKVERTINKFTYLK